MDRTLVLLEGDGLDLTAGDVLRRVDVETPMISFAGEAITTARLVGGPVRDLNVMTRRTRYRHAVAALAPGTVTLAPGTEGTVALVLLERSGWAEIDGKKLAMDRFDAAISSSARQVSVDQQALLIRIWRASGL